MNQLLDIAGSYIIGGIVLVSLVSLTFYFNGKAQETKLEEVTQRSLIGVGTIIENDFEKMGYRVEDDVILNCDSSSIKFLADLDNNGKIDTVEYSVIKQNSQFLLKRYVAELNSNTSWTFPVKSLSIIGLDAAGTSTNNINDIQSVELKIETAENTIDDSQYKVGSYWERHFYPKNL